MVKLSEEVLKKMRKRYKEQREAVEVMHAMCFRKMGADGVSAVCLIQVNDGYEACFNDAEIVSQLTGLPLVPDYGFVRCCIGAATRPIIEALHRDGRSAAVIEWDEAGNLTPHYFPRSQYRSLSKTKTARKQVAVAV